MAQTQTKETVVAESEVNPDIEIKAKPIDPPPQVKKGMEIQVRKGGADLAPANHLELLAFIDRMIESKSVPRHLENRLQVLAAWNFAAQLKLPPQPSLRNIAVIEGNPSLFGDLPLSLVEAHKDFKFYREYLISDDYREICIANKNLNADIYAGVIEIQRKGMKEPATYTFTREEALKAGLMAWNEKEKVFQARKRNGEWSPHSPWSKYQGTMYIRRARGKGIKAHFADAICGAGIAEYDYHQAPDLENIRDVTVDTATNEFKNKIADLD